VRIIWLKEVVLATIRKLFHMRVSGHHLTHSLNYSVATHHALGLHPGKCGQEHLRGLVQGTGTLESVVRKSLATVVLHDTPMSPGWLTDNDVS
jgi:hypothetical protein